MICVWKSTNNRPGQEARPFYSIKLNGSQKSQVLNHHFTDAENAKDLALKLAQVLTLKEVEPQNLNQLRDKFMAEDPWKGMLVPSKAESKKRPAAAEAAEPKTKAKAVSKAGPPPTPKPPEVPVRPKSVAAAPKGPPPPTPKPPEVPVRPKSVPAAPSASVAKAPPGDNDTGCRPYEEIPPPPDSFEDTLTDFMLEVVSGPPEHSRLMRAEEAAIRLPGVDY